MPEVVSKVELTEGGWQSSRTELEVGGKASLQTSWAQAKVTVFLPLLLVHDMISRGIIVSDVDDLD